MSKYSPLDPVELKRRRANLGMSMEELALAAGVSRGTVKNAEWGRKLNADTRTSILNAIERAEQGRLGEWEDARPALVYIGIDGATHAVDVETWVPGDLPGRERAVLRALLTYVLARLDGGAA